MDKTMPDAVLVSYNEKTFALYVQRVNVTSATPQKIIEKKRNKNKDKYEGLSGRKFSIAFYNLGDKKIKVTDFFRAVLVDPEVYVRHMLFNGNTMAIVADEFTLNEVWKSKAKKGTDLGCYQRLIQMLAYIWRNASPGMENQLTKEYFEKEVAK